MMLAGAVRLSGGQDLTEKHQNGPFLPSLWPDLEKQCLIDMEKVLCLAVLVQCVCPRKSWNALSSVQRVKNSKLLPPLFFSFG